ncbi:hypothetical protein [Amycolatopsis sp. NPDC051128]|uniref:hypothetical protein n=1 Tax=Amycolatopsis sp. NPDC051128 TaxID=3155412 RepID=UPI00343EB3E0
MRMRTAVLVVPVLVVELVACGRPVVVVKTGRAVPVPARTEECTWLGDTPVAPEVVRL